MNAIPSWVPGLVYVIGLAVLAMFFLLAIINFLRYRFKGDRTLVYIGLMSILSLVSILATVSLVSTRHASVSTSVQDTGGSIFSTF